MRNLITRALCALALLCALSTSAFAIDVTIASASFPGYNYSGATAKLRIYPSQTFTASDSVTVPGGTTPGSTTGFFTTVNCTVASNTLTCPSFTLKSTTDSLDLRDTTYTVVLFDAAGTRRDFFPVSDFILPHTAGSNMTWADVRIYQGRNTRAPVPGTLDADQTLAAINANNTTGNPAKPYASPTPLGRVSLSWPATDSALPIAVSRTDPLVSSFLNLKAYPFLATGDGTADDTAELQSLVDAADFTKGSVLIIPPGSRYKISAPVVLPRVEQFGVYSNVTIMAYGAVFDLTTSAASAFYYHPSTQAQNDNVIYNRVTFLGGIFRAATRTPGQTAIDISSCEQCLFEGINFTNMNGIHLRTAYGTIVEGNNVQVDNEFGIKIEGGDWTGATSTNSPSNGTVVRNNRVIPGSGSIANIWLKNADLTGVEGPGISDAPDALYPGSGSPQYDVLIDNSGYSLGQTNWIRGYYSERPTNPSVAVIGAILNHGTLTVDLFRRYDDATGVVYVDATGSTSDSTIKLRDWPRIDASPTPRFKTASGVQWRMDGVGEAASRNFLDSAWWVGGTVGNVSQWGQYGITINPGPTVIAAYQLGRYGASAEASFGIARAVNDWFNGTAAGDAIIRAADRTKTIKLAVGDGTNGNDLPVVTIGPGAVGVGNTGLLLLENGTPKQVKIGVAGTGPGGAGRALYVD
jgi:hypothetical protein